MERVSIDKKTYDGIDFKANPSKKAKFSLAQVAGLLDKYDIEIDGAN